ncbi:hypothetical protein D3C84_1029870 [compost metagenome]
MSGFCTAIPIPIAGTARIAVENTVQLRPPNCPTPNVYTKRSVAPTRPGIAANVNNCSCEKAKPISFNLTATTDQICQTIKASINAGTEIQRLRVA